MRLGTLLPWASLLGGAFLGDAPDGLSIENSLPMKNSQRFSQT